MRCVGIEGLYVSSIQAINSFKMSSVRFGLCLMMAFIAAVG